MGIKKYVVGAFETNTYVISKGNKAVIIDPGLNFSSILDEIKDLEVEAILITHGHVDHIDGCGFINAPIYVGKEDLNNFSDKNNSLYSLTYQKPSFDYHKLNLIAVSDNMEINLPSFSFTAIHTPGHTIGSYCYLYYRNLFSGDTLFKCSIGRTDFPTGSYKMMKTSLDKLKTMISDEVVIYPGHDEKSTMKFEKQNNPYLK